MSLRQKLDPSRGPERTALSSRHHPFCYRAKLFRACCGKGIMADSSPFPFSPRRCRLYEIVPSRRFPFADPLSSVRKKCHTTLQSHISALEPEVPAPSSHARSHTVMLLARYSCWPFLSFKGKSLAACTGPKLPGTEILLLWRAGTPSHSRPIDSRALSLHYTDERIQLDPETRRVPLPLRSQ